jgi:hypothetical protein
MIHGDSAKGGAASREVQYADRIADVLYMHTVLSNHLPSASLLLRSLFRGERDMMLLLMLLLMPLKADMPPLPSLFLSPLNCAKNTRVYSECIVRV